MPQYLMMREVARGVSADELVLFGGDMNEDMFTYDYNGPEGTQNGDEYYQEMLRELDATDPNVTSVQKYSYDNVENALTGHVYPVAEEGECRQRLDYVMFSNAHLKPLTSFCEILTPKWPEDCDGSGEDVECELSDHFPVTCTYKFEEEEVSNRHVFLSLSAFRPCHLKLTLAPLLTFVTQEDGGDEVSVCISGSAFLP